MGFKALKIEKVPTNLDVLRKKYRHLVTIGGCPVRMGIDIAHDQFKTVFTLQLLKLQVHVLTKMAVSARVKNQRNR